VTEAGKVETDLTRQMGTAQALARTLGVAATEDIVRRVEAIQTDTSGAIAAIARIDEVISQISD
jgi:hypothetical protein